MPVMTETQQHMRDDLLAHLIRKPFVPFVIVMADGTRHDVVRPYQASVGETIGRVAPAVGGVGSDFRIRDVRAIEPATNR